MITANNPQFSPPAPPRPQAPPPSPKIQTTKEKNSILFITGLFDVMKSEIMT